MSCVLKLLLRVDVLESCISCVTIPMSRILNMTCFHVHTLYDELRLHVNCEVYWTRRMLTISCVIDFTVSAGGRSFPREDTHMHPLPIFCLPLSPSTRTTHLTAPRLSPLLKYTYEMDTSIIQDNNDETKHFKTRCFSYHKYYVVM